MSETRRRTEAERRICSQMDCPGDGRYQPPGKGHLPGCSHNAVRWSWEDIPTDAAPPRTRTHGLNHAPLPKGVLLDPGFCTGCDEERTTPPPSDPRPTKGER